MLLSMASCAYMSMLGAQTTEQFQPYFASLRNDRVNLRSGPGMQYVVEWIYQRKSLPVEVINKYRDWLQIQDMDKITGWVRQDQISVNRTVITTAKTTLQSQNQQTSAPIVRLDAGVVLFVDYCQPAWCYIRIKDYQGWVNRAQVWGLYTNETIEQK